MLNISAACRVAILVVSVSLLTSLAAMPVAAQEFVFQGSDYLAAGDAYLDFSLSKNGFGVVALEGNPNFTHEGAGNVSVIIQREENSSNFDSELRRNGQIRIIDLSLQSDPKHPIKNKNGFLYNITVTLDPARLPNCTGEIEIYGDKTGGTFLLSLNIYFRAFFDPVNKGPSIAPVVGLREVTAIAKAQAVRRPTWSSEIPPSTFIIPGIYPSQFANAHFFNPEAGVDFFNPKPYILVAPRFRMEVAVAKQSF